MRPVRFMSNTVILHSSLLYFLLKDAVHLVLVKPLTEVCGHKEVHKAKSFVFVRLHDLLICLNLTLLLIYVLNCLDETPPLLFVDLCDLVEASLEVFDHAIELLRLNLEQQAML